jgi:hypothetical protein
MFQKPPIFWYDQEVRDSLGIREDDLRGEYDPRPPSGAMYPFLGRRYDPEEIADAICSVSCCLEEPDGGNVEPVRAFEVQPLPGATLHAESEEDLGDRLRRLLTERLPGNSWEPPMIVLGALRKYFILHASVPAPPDETTGQPMGLELYGELTSVGGVRLATPEGQAWREDRWERQYGQSRPEETGTLLRVEGPLEIEILVVTYANIENPSIGIPFYM